MKHATTAIIIATAILSFAAVPAHANNNKDAAQCVVFGLVSKKQELAGDALKLADNQNAAMTIAKAQMREANAASSKVEKEGYVFEWAGACRRLGLQSSSYTASSR